MIKEIKWVPGEYWGRDQESALIEKEHKEISGKIRLLEDELANFRKEKMRLLRAWVELNPNGDTRPL